MKQILFIAFLFFSLSGCEKWSEDSSNQYVAKVVGFDPNCSTCILAFPNDSLRVKDLLGESPNNYYQAINLDRDQFKTGQMIKVHVRKPEETELRACITLYPSNNYSEIFVSDYRNLDEMKFNEPIYLRYGACIGDCGNRNTLCFDSVITDSRCPENLVCVWAGEAIVRFRLEKYGKEPRFIDLHIGTKDTIIDGLKFSFIDLLPYPNTDRPTSPEDYRAKIILKHI